MFFKNKEDHNKEQDSSNLEQEATQMANDECCKENDSCQNENNNDADYQACTQELTAVKEQLVRLGADFQNYKKRMEKEREEWADVVQSRVFVDLLPVVDNFDRAIVEAEKEGISPELAQWLSGFELIHKELSEFLKKNKITTIEAGNAFDPELHEALMHVDSADYASGSVVQILQKGYILRGKVLRPAKVSVAR